MYLKNFKTLLFDSVKPLIFVKPKCVIGSKGNVYQLLEKFSKKKLISGTKFVFGLTHSANDCSLA